MRRSTSAFVLSALVALTACETQEGTDVDVDADTTAVVDGADVEEQIRAVNDRFEQALLAGDSLGLTDLYTDDGVVMAPGAPKAEGRDAIRAAFGGMMAGGTMTAANLETERIETASSGDLAYEVGSFSMAGTAPDGTEWTDEGKYLVVWENVGGEWKLAADAWNSNAMPGAAPADAAAPAGTDEEDTTTM